VRRGRFRSTATASVVAVAVALSSGCVVTDGGYDYGGAAYGVGYYEPSGIAYGGWGPGYDIAPFRGGGHYPVRYGGRPSPHAYRAAPASRAMPSIPTGARPGGGGGHGGGGRGGGGGGHR
jgi:hypothetical protein